MKLMSELLIEAASVIGGRAWGADLGKPRIYMQTTRGVSAYFDFPDACADDLGGACVKVFDNERGDHRGARDVMVPKLQRPSLALLAFTRGEHRLARGVMTLPERIDRDAAERLGSAITRGDVDLAWTLLGTTEQAFAEHEERQRAALLDAAQADAQVATARAAFPRIAELMLRPMAKLAAPKLRITIDGIALRISVATARSAHPDTVNVTSPGSFESRTWYGRIDPRNGGAFQPGRACPAEVVAALAKLEQGPEVVLAHAGRESGSCCYCARDLTDERSVRVGYGPVCAGHWGLPWGDEHEAEAASVEHAEQEAERALGLL